MVLTYLNNLSNKTNETKEKGLSPEDYQDLGKGVILPYNALHCRTDSKMDAGQMTPRREPENNTIGPWPVYLFSLNGD